MTLYFRHEKLYNDDRMSIRKPHNCATSSSGYLTAPNRNVSTSSDWTVPYLSNEWRNVSATGTTWEIKNPEFIPTPGWVERIDGYIEEAFDMTTGPRYVNERIVAVCYKPERTLGVGFTKVFLADNDLKNVFPQMKGVWEETQRRIESENTLCGAKIGTCKIDGNGRISSAFGIPDLPSLFGENKIHGELAPGPPSLTFSCAAVGFQSRTVP